MHMADSLLSPVIGATFWAGTSGALAYSAKKLKESMDERIIPLMGVLGAFIFAAQMINFTIPGTGSSGHLGGGMILAVILGPYAGFMVIASVLAIQALFFADGGLLALGCNIWNLGIYPCFAAYPLIYRPLVKTGSSPQRIATASVLSAVVGLQLGAFSVVIETMLSGRSELPFNTFVLLMQPIHLAIGLVEGIVTAGVINFVYTARPEIIETARSVQPLAADISMKKVLGGLLVVAVLTGGLFSWFASDYPDGLEWSIEKIFGKTEIPERESNIGTFLKSLQEKTAFLPDYNLKQADTQPAGPVAGNHEPSGPPVETGRSVSGIVGAVLVLLSVFLIRFIITFLRRKGSAKRAI